MKPLGYKSYGSIPHFPGSRMGPGDHHCSPGQLRIATEKARDKNDLIIVQEKLDGGNVGICKVSGKILAITRAGYLAETSPYRTHFAFAEYVRRNEELFNELLNEGERLCGEWLFTAVGTKYRLPHEPFVAFDIMNGTKRLSFSKFNERLGYSKIQSPRVLSIGQPLAIDEAMHMLALNIANHHGALEAVEGAIWRVERNGEVDFLCKYVRPDKVDGKYLKKDVFNELPDGLEYLKEAFYNAEPIVK